MGDGGAITTSDANLAEVLFSLRNYGSSKKYHNDYVYYISVIIKSFIRRERLDLLKIIFIRRSPSFLFKKNDLSSVEVLEVLKNIGCIILMILNSLKTLSIEFIGY